MEHKVLWMPLKFMGVLLIVILLLIIPVCAIFAPIAYIGSIFDDSFGSLRDNFGIDYDADFTDELDSYIYENRISPDYNGITGHKASRRWSSINSELKHFQLTVRRCFSLESSLIYSSRHRF